MNTDFFKIIQVAFQKIIDDYSFQIEQITDYEFVIKNEICSFKIICERYLDRFDLLVKEINKDYWLSIFKLFEFLCDKDSRFQSKLLPVKSEKFKRKDFSRRFFAINKIKNQTDFIKNIQFVLEVVETEFDYILLNEDFEFHTEYHEFRKASVFPYDKLSKLEKSNYENDYKIIYEKEVFVFPGNKVKQEIIDTLPNKNIFNEFSLNREEKEWISALKKEYNFIGNHKLSKDYITAFEKQFKLNLPRDFKLFLNQIGNGFNLFPLEASVAHYINSYAELFCFIDFNSDFDETKRYEAICGALRIHDLGCGMSVFLVVSENKFGEIWVDDRANMDEIRPWIKDEKTSFKDWYKSYFSIIKNYKVVQSSAPLIENTENSQIIIDEKEVNDMDLPF